MSVGVCGGGGGLIDPPPPAGPVTIHVKTTVQCSPDSSMVTLKQMTALLRRQCLASNNWYEFCLVER